MSSQYQNQKQQKKRQYLGVFCSSEVRVSDSKRDVIVARGKPKTRTAVWEMGSLRLWLGRCIPFLRVVIFTLLIQNTASGNMLAFCKTGRTDPLGDIAIEYGTGPLNITCAIVDEKILQERPNISSFMYFTKDNVEVRNITRILNSSSIQLYDENPQKSKAMYNCLMGYELHTRNEKREEFVCCNNVEIGVKPYGVTDFMCVSNNYENLTCSWTPLSTVVSTNYTLSFHYGTKMQIKNDCPIEYPSEPSNMGKIRCVLDLSTTPQYRLVQPIYYFTLHMSNGFGNHTNPIYEFHHFKHVRSGPPEKLEAVNTTTSSIYLNWSIPSAMVTFPKPLQYRVVYQCVYGPKKWLPGGPNNGTIFVQHHSDTSYYYNLTGLAHAHDLCDIRVAIRSYEAREDESMWSQHASITVRTSSKVPGAPPNTTTGSFEIIFSEITTATDATQNQVYIYWQQIPDSIKNSGEDFRYECIALPDSSPSSKVILVDTTNAYAKFSNLDLRRTYRFAVYSVNSHGRSERHSEVIVPAQVQRPREPAVFTKVSFDHGVYELRWEMAVHDSVHDHRPAVTGYTLFWCSNDRDRPYQCNGHLSWIHLPANVTMHNVTTIERQQVTQFALSANSDANSSGMVWASCTILHDKLIGKVRDFWINNVRSTSIELGWKLACSERIGNVVGYTINYCPIISPQNTSCKDNYLQQLELEGDTNRIHGNVTDLKPYTTYMLRIAVVTSMSGTNKTSQLSEPLYNTTLEAAPTSPRNLHWTNLTNASVTLYWNGPDVLNGVLKYYRLRYNGLSAEVVPGPDPIKYDLVSLQSYETYNMTVSACTTFCSEPSTMVSVLTKMGSPGIIKTIDKRFQNDSYVLVNWPEPKPLRGRCDYYQLKIKQEVDYKNETLPITNSTERKYAVSQCGDNNRYNTFYMSVRAVNVIDDIAHPGPWSDEIKFFCKAPPMSIFWLIFSTILAIFVCLFIWLSRRCYYHYRDMRNVEVKLPPGLAPPTSEGLPYWSDGHLNGGKGATLSDHILNPNVVGGLSGGVGSLGGLGGLGGLGSALHNLQGLQHLHHISNDTSPIKSDEELVLLKITNHDHRLSGDSSGCSTAHESVTSSLDMQDRADLHEHLNESDENDFPCDDVNVQREQREERERNGKVDRCSTDSGTDQVHSNSTHSLNQTSSLRLRKQAANSANVTYAPGSGYITMPTDSSQTLQPNQAQSHPVWPSAGANANGSTYCMLGIDPTAGSGRESSAHQSAQSAEAPASPTAFVAPYVSIDAHQHQPMLATSNCTPPPFFSPRDLRSGHEMDFSARAIPMKTSEQPPPMPSVTSMSRTCSPAAPSQNVSGYIPLLYADPTGTGSDLDNTLQLLPNTPPTPPHPPPPASSPPYVMASTKATSATLAAACQPRADGISAITIAPACATHLTCVGAPASLYVQAAPLTHHNKVTLPTATPLPSSGYVRVGEALPPIQTLSYISHRNLLKED